MSKTDTPNKYLLVFFWLIAIFCLLYRILYIHWYPELFYIQDSGGYFYTAHNWIHHNAFKMLYIRTPLYPFFLLAVVKSVGLPYLNLVQQLFLFNVFLASAYLLIKIYPTNKGILLATLFLVITCFCPSMIHNGAMIMTEGLAPTFLFLAIISFYLWQQKQGIIRLGFFAFIIALTILLRPINIVFIPAAFIAFYFVNKAGIIKNVSLFLIFCFIMLLPWMAMNKKMNNRFALSNMLPLALIHSYGHLADMNSALHNDVKEKLLPGWKRYMAKRADMNDNDLIFAGYELGFGPDSFDEALKKNFCLTSAQKDKISMDIILEGMKKNAGSVFALFLKRLYYFYTNLPVNAASLYKYQIRSWSESVLASDKIEIEWNLYYDYCGLPQVDLKSRQARYEKAIFMVKPMMDISSVYSILSRFFLWLSIILFPVFFIRQNNLAGIGVFIFLFIHFYALIVCATVPPELRYYQPLEPVVMFLLFLELGIIAHREKRAGGQGYNPIKIDS